MRDDASPGAGRDGPTGWESRLLAVPDGAIPDSLLARCLGTVPGSSGPMPARPKRPLARAARVAAAALALIGLATWAARPRPADAAHLLRAINASWSKVPAAHRVVRHRLAGGPRTEESWFVRDKGRRKEVRSGDELIGVVVFNHRWEFRWDVRGRTVAAWAAGLVDPGIRPDEEGLVLESEGLLRWAEAHRAEIRDERDTLLGREVRKIVLRWPGPAGGAALAGEQTVWFDPGSLRPLKQRVEHGDGQSTETTIDYPAPDAVPADLFAFPPPRDVSLEINDPDLGRQVYSQGRAPAGSPPSRSPKGADR